MTFNLNKVESITPQSNLIHSNFSDLINNYVYYHSETKTEKQEVWPNLPPKYDNYKSILELKDDIINNPEYYVKKGSVTVRCLASLLYTCDSKLSGQKECYDRLHLTNDIKNKAGTLMNEQSGFAPHSDALHGMVRWTYDKSGKVDGFTIVKDRGNLRTWIALKSNAGNDVEILITLDFHEANPKQTLSELKIVEAEVFSSDAIDRRGFNAETRFRSTFLAGRPNSVAQGEWLNSYLNVDYANIIGDEREKVSEERPKYRLSSLQGLDFDKKGSPGGYIHKYGQYNIWQAVETLKDIMEERGGSTELSMSAIQAFTKTFYYLTETPAHIGCKNVPQNCKSAIASKDDIKESIVFLYKLETRRGNYKLSLSNLNKKGDTKDTTLLAFWEYIPAILEDMREVKHRTNDFGTEHPSIKAYLNSITDSRNRTIAANAVSK